MKQNLLKFNMLFLCLLIGISTTLHAQQPQLILQKGHTAPITDIVISEDGRYIISGSFDGTIHLWDALSKKELRVFDTQSMGHLELALKGNLLAGATNEGVLKIWQLDDGKLLNSFSFEDNPINKMDFHPKKSEMLLGLADGKIMLLNYENKKRSKSVQAHAEWVNDLGFSANGKSFFTCGEEGLFLWKKRRLSKKKELLKTQTTTAKFSEDGAYLISGDEDGMVKVFETAKGTPISTLKGHKQRLIYTDISRDNGTIVSVDFSGKAKVWNVQTQDTIQTFGVGKGTTSMVLHPDGRTLMTGFRKDIRLWRTETGKKITDLTGLIEDWESKSINAVRFGVDTQSIVSAGERTLRFWTETSSEKIELGDIIEQVILHPDGRHVATLEENGQIVLWDVITKDTVRTFYGKSNYITFTENGHLILGYSGRQLYIWQTGTGELVDFVTIGNKDVFKLAIHPDNTTVAISTIDGEIYIYDYRTGAFLAECEKQPHNFFALTFTKDGRHLVGGTEDGYLTIWNVSNGKFHMKIRAHESMVSTLYVDDEFFISADISGEIGIWNHFLEPIGKLKGHTKMVMDIDRKGDFLVTCAADNTIRLWDFKNQDFLAKFYAFDDDWAVIAPDGLFDASENAMSKMHYVIGLEPLELSQLKERYYEPGLLGELLNIGSETKRDVSKLDKVPLFPMANLEWIDEEKLILKVTLTERSGGIGKVSLFINKKELIEDINPKRKKEFEIKLVDFQRFLKQDNDDFFTIKTYNKAGWLSSKPEAIRYTGAINLKGSEVVDEGGKIKIKLGQTHEPKMYAIIIGTSNYRGEKLDLSYADKDAGNIAEGLRGVGKSLFGEDNIHINLLTSTSNRPATKANIQAVFAEVAAVATPEDIVVLYLSGHGVTYGSTDPQFYYLTKDIASENIEDKTIRDNFTVATSELTEMLKSIPAQKQVLIIDACSSGSLVDNVLSQTRGLSSSQRRALDRMKDRTGMFILAGSAANKVSYEASQFGQGLLTYSLLLGMNGSALRDGQYVDVMQLFQYAADKVPEFAAFIGGMQRPVIATPAGSNSFDIGQVTSEVIIPMTEVKPLFVRSNFQEEVSFDDKLELAETLDNRLMDISAQGKSASILFVNVQKYPNAYAVKGRYTIKNEKITLNIHLFKGEELVKKIKVNGSKKDVDALINLVLLELE